MSKNTEIGLDAGVGGILGSTYGYSRAKDKLLGKRGLGRKIASLLEPTTIRNFRRRGVVAPLLSKAERKLARRGGIKGAILGAALFGGLSAYKDRGKK